MIFLEDRSTKNPSSRALVEGVVIHGLPRPFGPRNDDFFTFLPVDFPYWAGTHLETQVSTQALYLGRIFNTIMTSPAGG